jgi:hypothetical protein
MTQSKTDQIFRIVAALDNHFVADDRLPTSGN